MRIIIFILLLLPLGLSAQQSEAALKREARKLVREGNELYAQEKYADAEVAYKKALKNDPQYEIAQYNLGNALLALDRNDEARAAYDLVNKMSENDLTKASTFHNIGNSFYNEKNYQAAVDSYKNSLRLEPSDEETRYNLALAQKMLEDQQNQQNQDQNDDNKDNKDQQDKNQDQNNENQDNKDQDDQNKDENQNNDNQQNDQNDKKPEDQKKDQKQQPQPGKLSPKQVQQLLEAMNNEEKKTQEKMNAKKQKGKKTKQEKDW
ncbi:hypothetical protein KH5_07130 [Urechidicola sp. KH5]